MNIWQEFVIQEALEEHDKNGDGFVSLEEFLGDYRRDPSKLPVGKAERVGVGIKEVAMFSEALYDKRSHTGTPSLPDMLLCSFLFPCMFQTFPSLSSKYNVIVN